MKAAAAVNVKSEKRERMLSCEIKNSAHDDDTHSRENCALTVNVRGAKKKLQNGINFSLARRDVDILCV